MDTRVVIGTLAVTLALVTCCSAVVQAQDVSAYRGVRLGMTVGEVATAAGVPPADVTVSFQRPVLVQELEWRHPAGLSVTDVPTDQDSVASVRYTFCNGALYRIVVSYDPDRTEGLTDQDMVDALAPVYGTARMPGGKVVTSPVSQTYADTEAVTATWEDARASVTLFHGTYRSTFGLIISGKALSAQAQAGIVESMRLATLDAPRRELAEQKARDDIENVAHAKARLLNKAAFRY
jgi:hypothetical protein